jgi:uncharacterized RDD family membrane protein YckC
VSEDPWAGRPEPTDGSWPSGEEGGRQPAVAAGLGARIGARLLDALLVGIPVSIVLALLGVGTAGFGARGWVTNVVLSALWFGYFVWFESNRGATLGKRLLNLRVVAVDGGLPSMEAAAKRNVWMLFGLIPVVGGLLWVVAVIVITITISSNADNRGYHDTFAGTAVTR